MRIEIPIPNLKTAIRFKQIIPPEGVTVNLPAQQYSSLPVIGRQILHVIVEVGPGLLKTVAATLFVKWITRVYDSRVAPKPPVYVRIDGKEVKFNELLMRLGRKKKVRVGHKRRPQNRKRKKSKPT